MNDIRLRQATIGPKYAQELIDKTQGKMQRSLDNDRVIQYSIDMATGHWQENGSTVVVDTEDLIADGWHRLHACVRAEKSFPTILVTGMPPENRATIDDGRKRQLKDDLKMNGVVNAPALEALTRKIVSWQTYGGFGSGRIAQVRISRYQLSRIYKEHEAELLPALQAANAHRNKNPMNFGGQAFITWLLQQGGNPEQLIGKYGSIMQIGSQEIDDQVIVRFAEMLREGKYRGERSSVAEQIYHAIRAWNAWLTHEYIGYQKPRGGLKLPFPTPVQAEIVVPSSL